MNTWLVIILTLSAVFVGGLASPPLVFAQELITVNSTTPCFLNYTAGTDMWRNCGYDDDYIDAALSPWEWITGGNFSLVIVSMLVLVSYIKYHKAVYPLIIGVMFLPISFFVFPSTFISFSIVMAGVLMGVLIWYIFVRQTKEY